MYIDGVTHVYIWPDRYHAGSGAWPSTPFRSACARVYPAVSSKFGKYPFLARCGLVCLGLAQKHRQLATVHARVCCGTTKGLRPTSKRPTAQTRPNVISIPQGLFRWLLHTMMRHDVSRSWVLTPISCSSRTAPSAPDNADTDNEDSYIQIGLLVWPSNQNIDWWHWLVACGPHAKQPTTQALPSQGNYHMSAGREPVSRNPSRDTSSWHRPIVVNHRLSAPRPWTRIYRHTQLLYQTSQTIILRM